MSETDAEVEEVECEICGNSYSSYGISGHIKHSHEISVDEYVKKYGEFRKSKKEKERSHTRETQNIKCEECGDEYSSAGMHTHLKHTHEMSVNEYVEKYGEYRKKQKNRQSKKEDSDYHCKICDENLISDRQLSFHVRKQHGITKEQYVLEHIFDGSHPTCKCGCGKKVKILSYEPYKRDYISGHNAKGENNPMFGRQFDEGTRQLMRKRAKERIENHDGRLPMHNRIAILQNTYGIWENYLEFLEDKKDITCVSERSVLESGENLEFKCKKCRNTWQSFSLGTDCSECKEDKSSQERELYYFIKEDLGFDDVVRNDRSVLPNENEIDVLIPSKSLGIEFDSLFWHSENRSGKHKYYHLNKTKKASEVGYDLIHIFSDEWENNKEAVKSKISYILGESDEEVVYGRECETKQVSTQQAKSFINEYHLQGYSSSKYKLGLFKNGKILAVMTFSKPRAGIGSSNEREKNVFELNRYCTKLGVIPVGGMGKLFKHFVRNFEVDKVITFADRRWSFEGGNVYDKVGFRLESVSDPNYWYTLNYNERKHRFNFTKKRIVEEYNGDSEKTEWENMKEMGYDRIWDCGHLKYIWESS